MKSLVPELELSECTTVVNCTFFQSSFMCCSQSRPSKLGPVPCTTKHVIGKTLPWWLTLTEILPKGWIRSPEYVRRCGRLLPSRLTDLPWLRRHFNWFEFMMVTADPVSTSICVITPFKDSSHM